MLQDYDAITRNFEMVIDRYQEAKKQMLDEFKENLEIFIEAVLRENNFPHIHLVGYVPEYNDGDPCRFTFDASPADTNRAIEFFEETSDENSSVLSFLPPGTSKKIDFSNLENISYFDPKAKKVEKIFNKMKDIFEEVFDSFEIFAAIDAEGNFYYHLDDEYDCGH